MQNGLHTCVHVTRPICGEQLQLTFGGRASFHFSSVSRRRGGEGAGGGGWELGVGEGDRGWDDCKPSPCQLRAMMQRVWERRTAALRLQENLELHSTAASLLMEDFSPEAVLQTPIEHSASIHPPLHHQPLPR